MTTGHVVPGYGPIVSKFRSKSADPTMSGYRFRMKNVEDKQNELFDIKDLAKVAWENELKEWDTTPEVKPTTYSHSFYAKNKLARENPTVMRPSSVTRRNKPHPPEVFVKCHLHKVPGYHDPYAAQGKEMGVVEGFQNADTTVKEEVYLVDAFCSDNEKQERDQLRWKYLGRQSTPEVMRFKSGKMRRAIDDPWDSQAAEAWMKLANERDKRNVNRVINRCQPSVRPRVTNFRPTQSAYHASTRRFLRATGAEESEAVSKMMETLTSRPKTALPMSGPHFHITDYSNIPTNIRINPRHTRTDFTIHPELYP